MIWQGRPEFLRVTDLKCVSRAQEQCVELQENLAGISRLLAHLLAALDLLDLYANDHDQDFLLQIQISGPPV